MDSLPLYVSVHSDSIENSSMKALDYSDDDTSLSSLDEGHQEGRQICTKNAPPPRVLVIDELETKQIKSKDCTLKISKEDGKLGSPNRSVTLSSPQNENDVRSKISTPVPWACRQGKKSNLIASSPSSNPSVFSTFIDYFCARSDQEDVNGTTTTKDSNRTQQIQKNQNDKFEYTITKTFLEAWISKKGSGNDIFGSISWKPRWCQLVLAKVPLYEVEVPLLLVSWHFSMPSPSTIIILDNKLAIRIDGVDSSDSNVTDEYANRFDVVSGDETTSPLASMMTRSFSAQTVEERNKWVDAINDAIGNFERSKKSFRRAHSALCLPPTIPRTASTKNVNFDDASELEGLDLVY